MYFYHKLGTLFMCCCEEYVPQLININTGQWKKLRVNSENYEDLKFYGLPQRLIFSLYRKEENDR